MSARTAIHVVRLAPVYWWAEVKERGGDRIEGRGGFTSEDEARAWAHEATLRHSGLSLVIDDVAAAG